MLPLKCYKDWTACFPFLSKMSYVATWSKVFLCFFVNSFSPVYMYWSPGMFYLEEPYWICLSLTNAAILVRVFIPKLWFFVDFSIYHWPCREEIIQSMNTEQSFVLMSLTSWVRAAHGCVRGQTTLVVKLKFEVLKRYFTSIQIKKFFCYGSIKWTWNFEWLTASITCLKEG